MFPALLVAVSLANTAPPMRIVTSADNGKTITIAKHQGLHIDLDECGSCGFDWETTAKPNPKVLARRSSTTKDPTCPPPKPGQPQCVGGSYTRVFRYTGKATGRTKLRLGYFGPGQSEPADTFRLTVRVR